MSQPYNVENAVIIYWASRGVSSKSIAELLLLKGCRRMSEADVREKVMRAQVSLSSTNSSQDLVWDFLKNTWDLQGVEAFLDNTLDDADQKRHVKLSSPAVEKIFATNGDFTTQSHIGDISGSTQSNGGSGSTSSNTNPQTSTTSG
ncbi:hypothetical protein MMC28_000604 [Mycoblastus sanguinarius]|nr:hypothetical protein [Mycoblastus sanguinarius]